MASARTGTAAEADRPLRERPLSWMLPLWGFWFAAYLGGGLLAESEGETGFLASTVDRVDSLWVEALLLNLPLQLVLVALALVLAQVGSAAAARLSRASAWLATSLIGAHLVLSLAVGLRGLDAYL